MSLESSCILQTTLWNWLVYIVLEQVPELLNAFQTESMLVLQFVDELLVELHPVLTHRQVERESRQYILLESLPRYSCVCEISLV